MPNPIHVDESPIRFDRLHGSLPNWLKRFLPIGGGVSHDHHGKGMFLVTVFLLSESIVFFSFFFTYIALRLTHPNWLPPGVSPFSARRYANGEVKSQKSRIQTF